MQRGDSTHKGKLIRTHDTLFLFVLSQFALSSFGLAQAESTHDDLMGELSSDLARVADSGLSATASCDLVPLDQFPTAPVATNDPFRFISSARFMTEKCQLALR